MAQINLSGKMTDGSAVDVTYLQTNIVLTSSDETIAKVNGLEVETLQPGKVTITATIGGVIAASFTLIVT